jgi:hypothetical protein
VIEQALIPPKMWIGQLTAHAYAHSSKHCNSAQHVSNYHTHSNRQRTPTYTAAHAATNSTHSMYPIITYTATDSTRLRTQQHTLQQTTRTACVRLSHTRSNRQHTPLHTAANTATTHSMYLITHTQQQTAHAYAHSSTRCNKQHAQHVSNYHTHSNRQHTPTHTAAHAATNSTHSMCPIITHAATDSTRLRTQQHTLQQTTRTACIQLSHTQQQTAHSTLLPHAACIQRQGCNSPQVSCTIFSMYPINTHSNRQHTACGAPTRHAYDDEVATAHTYVYVLHNFQHVSHKTHTHLHAPHKVQQGCSTVV